MTDSLCPKERSLRMSRVRSRDTKPEMAARQLIHGLGYRNRLQGRDLPGRPDIVFRSRRRVVFVHGCFWHRHEDPACRLARLPKSRLEFWLPKLADNARRDREAASALAAMGWSSLVIWECQLKKPDSLIPQITSFLKT